MSTKKRRSFFSILALPSGILLLVLEMARPRGTPTEHYFWLIVGSMLILLGAMEVFGKRPAAGPNDPINPRLDER